MAAAPHLIRLSSRCFLILLGLAAMMIPGRSIQAQPAGFAPLPSVELPPELDRVLSDYEAAWQASDEHALAALFTTDGFVPSQQGWVRGHAAIAQDYQNGSGDLSLRALAYAVENTMGYIIGAYNYGETSDGRKDRGNFVLVLRRQPGGNWLIVADIDKTNRQ
jgi:ketosteroid isomerase-like protein